MNASEVARFAQLYLSDASAKSAARQAAIDAGEPRPQTLAQRAAAGIIESKEGLGAWANTPNGKERFQAAMNELAVSGAEHYVAGLSGNAYTRFLVQRYGRRQRDVGAVALAPSPRTESKTGVWAAFWRQPPAARRTLFVLVLGLFVLILFDQLTRRDDFAGGGWVTVVGASAVLTVGAVLVVAPLLLVVLGLFAYAHRPLELLRGLKNMLLAIGSGMGCAVIFLLAILGLLLLVAAANGLLTGQYESPFAHRDSDYWIELAKMVALSGGLAFAFCCWHLLELGLWFYYRRLLDINSLEASRLLGHAIDKERLYQRLVEAGTAKPPASEIQENTAESPPQGSEKSVEPAKPAPSGEGRESPPHESAVDEADRREPAVHQDAGPPPGPAPDERPATPRRSPAQEFYASSADLKPDGIVWFGGEAGDRFGIKQFRTVLQTDLAPIDLLLQASRVLTQLATAQAWRVVSTVNTESAEHGEAVYFTAYGSYSWDGSPYVAEEDGATVIITDISGQSRGGSGNVNLKCLVSPLEQDDHVELVLSFSESSRPMWLQRQAEGHVARTLRELTQALTHQLETPVGFEFEQGDWLTYQPLSCGDDSFELRPMRG